MSGSERDIQSEIAARYIRENFEPSDRLAVVLVNKRANSVVQRIGSSAAIGSTDFQAWLRCANDQGYEVYISMNALREGAQGRTRADVAAIRHIYLDLDENGTAALDALLKRRDLPKPNYVINSSRDKWQVLWKVERFAKNEAEELQKRLAIDTGADPAATDCARVLRLPGFYNHKYAQPHLIEVQAVARGVSRPEDFPAFPVGDRTHGNRPAILVSRSRPRGTLSQSERDWAYAKRALARGKSPAVVVAMIADYRRLDKHAPRYYAELTVAKAMDALRAESGRSGERDHERADSR